MDSKPANFYGMPGYWVDKVDFMGLWIESWVRWIIRVDLLKPFQCNAPPPKKKEQEKEEEKDLCPMGFLLTQICCAPLLRVLPEVKWYRKVWLLQDEWSCFLEDARLLPMPLVEWFNSSLMSQKMQGAKQYGMCSLMPSSWHPMEIDLWYATEN